jgi:hypothetical protein
LNFDSNTFVIDAANNRVGVGTASPTFQLDVQNAGNTLARIGGSGTGQSGIYLTSGGAFNPFVSFLSSISTVEAGIVAVAGSAALAFNTTSANTERMRITSAGNVSIGTTADSYRLDVQRATGNNAIARFYNGSASGNTDIYVNNVDNAGDWLISRRSNGEGWSYMSGANPLVFLTNAAERMRIDSSGNVGIGAAASGYGASRLAVVGGELGLSNTSDARFYLYTGATVRGLLYADATRIQLEASGTNPLTLWTNSGERARISSAGELLVGTTAANPGYGNTNTGQQLGGSSVSSFSRAAADWVITCNQNTADGSTYYQMQFRVANVSKGSITSTSSATAYNTSSDYRIK